jgi:AcrR family transcriptional regulator
MGSGALQATGSDSANGSPRPRKLPPGPGRSREQVAASQLARIHRATIALTAESGYEALKVRDIVGQAEVSTRAFYRHFDSKDDCFLHTYDRIVRNALRRIAAAQRGEPDWRKRARLMLDQLITEIASDPDAAHLVLVGARMATATAMERARRTERTSAELLRECVVRPPYGEAVPLPIAQGIVAGALTVAKHRLEAGDVDGLRDSLGELASWAASYVDPAAGRLADLGRKSVWRGSTLESTGASRTARDRFPSATGDRARLLSAVAALVATEGYAEATVPRIRASARVSRQAFHAHFDDAEACCIAALEERVEDMISQATRAKVAATSTAGGVYRAISVICHSVSSDPFLTRLCFFGEFPPGANGRRARNRLVSNLIEALRDGAPNNAKHDLAIEASVGAAWSVFRAHAFERASQSEETAATLAYLALAPSLGPSRTVKAIGAEQQVTRY